MPWHRCQRWQTKTCERCHGTGVVENRQSTPFGVFITQTTCPTCHGAGSVPEQVCPVCHGTGVVKRQRTLDLQIPPGIENNDVITLKGQGNAVKDGASGDINVTVKIIIPPPWRRKRKGSLHGSARALLPCHIGWKD